MKKLMFSLLTLSLALFVLTASYAQEDVDIDILRAADVNADGMIDILDLVLVAGFFGETPTENQTVNPDVNGDGKINILDLVLVASHLGETVRLLAVLERVEPARGLELIPNDSITLTFDHPPEDITVSEGVFTITDNTVTITGPFTPGTLELTITWSDGSEVLTYTVRQPADFVSAEPAVDSELIPNDSITMTFNHPPEDVTVSEGVATITDNTVTIMGPFTPGTLELTITWSDGSEVLTYTVRQPADFVSAEPTVDSELIPNDSITMTFNHPPEDVTVSEGVATITDNTVTITGPFTPGTLELTITWADGSEVLTYTVRQPADFMSAEPTVDSELTTNDSITLTFDHPPEDVTVSEGDATITDNTVTITGPFTPGTLELTITWADGSETLNYTVRQSAALERVEPATGEDITPNDSITLMFDHPPEDVKVNEGVATITDNTVTITGPFTPGPLALTVTWADGSETFDYTVRQLVAFVSAEPALDSELTVDGTITLTFDNPPEDVTVSEGVATITDNTVTITGPFTPGDLELTVTWADGSLPFTYTVAEPDTEPPSITGGTISDGDEDVDAEAINSSALIEIAFSEDVSGTIALQTEAGDDVGWLGKVEGNKGRLELVKGKELDPETTYVIAGKVEDAAGNETDISITFGTARAYDGIPIEVTDADFETVVLGSKIPIVVDFYKDG